MAKGSDLDRVTAIVLREMRLPLIVLVGVYAVGMGVMMLIPGVNGKPMSAFHAFYFMTYTATTTGFGELPSEFTNPQRMWATVCLYMSVIAWVYAIGTIFRLIQNPHFTLALAQSRFARAVRRINSPFYIICGFGDTGSLLARGLSDNRISAVMIDQDVERIKALDLRDYNVSMPGLQGDASVPKNLQDAGVARPECRGVVLLTGDEDVNLKIAVMVRLLNPEADVICRSTSHAHDEEMAGLGRVTLVDPFEIWSREIGLALFLPELHTLDEWLVGAHGVTLDRLIAYPRGTWILCGYGELGKRLHQALIERGVETVIIDPHPIAETERGEQFDRSVRGLATRANLVEAGVSSAAGVIAATNSDSDNLAILLAARSLNDSVYLIVRQNHHENELAFNAASADLIMQSSLTTARRLLLQLISPMVRELLDHLEAEPELLAEKLLPELTKRIPLSNPALWSLTLEATQVSEALLKIAHQERISLRDLSRDSRQRERDLAAVPLMLARGTDRIFLPGPEQLLAGGDEILFCTTRTAERVIRKNVMDPYISEYLATGKVSGNNPLVGWFVSSSGDHSLQFFRR